MRQPTKDQLRALLTESEPPCISLYQPTHRHYPDAQQDPIRYRNLLRDIEDSLRQKYPGRQTRVLMEKFRALERDEHFWLHRTDGLAMFAAGEFFEIFDLQRPVAELLVVADSFHTKPLLRDLQSADRYQILCLSRSEAKLYEGNRDVLDPVELAGIPSTLTEALGQELTEPHLTAASYGGAGGSFSAHGQPAMHHGHGSRKDEVDADVERFFRVIDRGVLEHHSQPSGLPLMLAALPENHAPFRNVSRNPLLMDRGIMMDPESLSADQLRVEAWKQMEPRYHERLAKLVDDYGTAHARQLASDDMAEVAHAAALGRVGTLLVEADREIPGRIDWTSGNIQSDELAHPEVDDVLDDLAEAVLRIKGDVVVVPADQMPSDTGLAAIYRY